VISENILLFPTLITVGKREVDELEKESWFSAYLDMSDGKGNSNEYTGHKSIHHDIRFTKVFSDIADTIRNHLTTLGVDTSMIEVNITKSFFNVKRHHGNPLHNHIENHISFTYYPYIHESCKKNLVFHQDTEKVSNDPYEGFLNHMSTRWHDINATSYSIEVHEGDIFVFPSKLTHSVENQDGPESFKTIDELRVSRFCVVGDAILTKNEVKDTDKSKLGYHSMLTPIENWRKF